MRNGCNFDTVLQPMDLSGTQKGRLKNVFSDDPFVILQRIVIW
ncbi:hypothetical protein NEISICOT_03283 [Neisseria sicca ATCC 29256]|uniref:Uncharacterized protein n=1 Tax=Neisseria sicca ATCC 29256 TaxID=547045 RepID=C6M9Q4_NEISI|nr:hypothetical protein NEISICOT_03283 [Neisseria sicca ATCC 29256]